MQLTNFCAGILESAKFCQSVAADRIGKTFIISIGTWFMSINNMFLSGYFYGEDLHQIRSYGIFGQVFSFMS